MCNIIHQRHYHANLHFDFLFKFTNFARQQERLLGIIHGLTSKVIQKKKEEVYRKACLNVGDEQRKVEENPTFHEIPKETDSRLEDKNNREMKMHYVRDDLDDIEDNDIGEKKRLAFLDLMLELKRNGEQLTDEEIKDEVDTIMFEVKL